METYSCMSIAVSSFFLVFYCYLSHDIYLTVLTALTRVMYICIIHMCVCVCMKNFSPRPDSESRFKTKEWHCPLDDYPVTPYTGRSRQGKGCTAPVLSGQMVLKKKLPSFSPPQCVKHLDMWVQ